jgi:hypothetical protein
VATEAVAVESAEMAYQAVASGEDRAAEEAEEAAAAETATAVAGAEV